MDKFIIVCMRHTSFMGAWGVPVSSNYIISGQVDAFNKYYGIQAVSARQVISMCNKKEKPNIERSKINREQGLDPGVIHHWYTYKKTEWKGMKPDETKEQDGLKFEYYKGVIPF